MKQLLRGRGSLLVGYVRTLLGRGQPCLSLSPLSISPSLSPLLDWVWAGREQGWCAEAALLSATAQHCLPARLARWASFDSGNADCLLTFWDILSNAAEPTSSHIGGRQCQIFTLLSGSEQAFPVCLLGSIWVWAWTWQWHVERRVRNKAESVKCTEREEPSRMEVGMETVSRTHTHRDRRTNAHILRGTWIHSLSRYEGENQVQRSRESETGYYYYFSNIIAISLFVCLIRNTVVIVGYTILFSSKKWGRTYKIQATCSHAISIDKHWE